MEAVFKCISAFMMQQLKTNVTDVQLFDPAKVSLAQRGWIRTMLCIQQKLRPWSCLSDPFLLEFSARPIQHYPEGLSLM